MNFQFSPLAAIAAVLLHIASSRMNEASAREESSEMERIIGGEEVTNERDFPYAVALFNNGSFICTGSIISPNSVLTAAHCVVTDGKAEDARQFHGIANVDKRSRTLRIDFISVRPHPEYNSNTFQNDLAIFQTERPIVFSDTVQPICVARSGTPSLVGKKVDALGWGSVNRFLFFPRIPDILRLVGLLVITNEECGRNYGSTVEEEKICATKPAKGICNGDSGGPLVHRGNDNVPVQIGVASYGSNLDMCFGLISEVWARVSSFNDFISENSDGATFC